MPDNTSVYSASQVDNSYLSYLNKHYKISKDWNIVRVIKNVQISASGDIQFTDNDILENIADRIESGVYVILTEGARPLTTWGCVPVCFHNSSTNKYGVHNIGTVADTIEISYAVLYPKNIN